MYLMKEKQGGPIPTGLKSWPLKLVKHLAETPCGRSNPMGDGVTLCSYIRRLGSFFGFKILNFNILLGLQKNKYFLGYDDFVDIFMGSSQNWTIFRAKSMHFRVFS